MKRGSTLFLRLVLIGIAIITLAVCLFGLPIAFRGDVTGYYRPVALGLYVTALPFFFALYQAWMLLTYIDTNTAFSDISVKALRTIKYCAFSIAALFLLGSPYLYYVSEKDDAPGVLAVALIIVGASFVIAVFAALLQRLLQNAIDIKNENDLTV